MAISPTVQEYQRRITQSRENSTPEQSTYNKKFGDRAYQVLVSKFPKLLRYIVTFKIVDSSIEESSGLGAFVVRVGAGVQYIPVVLSKGEIVSCEMVYNKEEGTLSPLSADKVRDIEGAGISQGEKLVRSPNIEDTRHIFREMYRPPPSSSVVLASARVDISQLPNHAKKALSDRIMGDPVLLSKVSQFYPVEFLAAKLAQIDTVGEEEPQLPAPPAVIKIGELSTGEVAALKTSEKQEILVQGFTIRTEPVDPVITLPAKNLDASLESALELIESTPDAKLTGRGFLIRLDGSELVRVSCLVIDGSVFTKRGVVRSDGKSIVFSRLRDGITAADLKEFGFKSPGEFTIHSGREISGSDGTATRKEKLSRAAYIYVCYPTRKGSYKQFGNPDSSSNIASVPRGDIHPEPPPPLYAYDLQKRSIDGENYISPKHPDGISLHFTERITDGYVQTADSGFLLPRTALCIHPYRDQTSYIHTLNALYKLFRKTGITVKMIDNGAGVTITDSEKEKTASFANIPDAVDYMVTHAGFDRTAVGHILADREVLVLNKQAYLQPPMDDSGTMEQADTGLYSTGHTLAPPTETPGVVEVDDEALYAASGIPDQDLFDVGMLSSIAGNDDIKGLIVDMLPQFIETLTGLGKSLLLFEVNREYVRDFYGEEEFNTMITSIRKIFRMIGELVYDLKKYINMH